MEWLDELVSISVSHTWSHKSTHFCQLNRPMLSVSCSSEICGLWVTRHNTADVLGIILSSVNPRNIPGPPDYFLYKKETRFPVPRKQTDLLEANLPSQIAAQTPMRIYFYTISATRHLPIPNSQGLFFPYGKNADFPQVPPGRLTHSHVTILALPPVLITT